MVDNQIEVEIDAGADPDEYVVRVVHAPSGGEPEGTVRLAIDELLERRQRVEETVLASSARARGGAVEELERPLRQVGQDLFDALFGGPIAGVYRSSQAVALDRGKRLRVVLRLRAPELSVLPWEALWDKANDAYVCRREPLVRHVPAPSPEPLPVQPPLRILGLVASPRGMPTLDVDAEQHHLEEALAGPIAEGRAQLAWEAQASWDRVLDRLLTGQWHVLHFIGHGDYDEATGEGRLALVGADERADWVEASRLADLLGEAEPTPRLVVLNSCSSGQGGGRDLFSGTAATLVRCGISAVAAMQFRVSDRAAVAFPRGFYTALAAGRSVDEAVRSGRIAILGAPHSLEWVTPVLYLRGNATRLFDLAAPAAPSRGQSPQPDRTARRATPAAPAPEVSATVPEPPDIAGSAAWADALSALYAGRLAEAVERFEALAASHPHDPRVRDRLAKARRERDLAGWYAEADDAASHEDWPDAIAALERVVAVDPAYRDAGQRLESCRAAQRRRSLVDEITALSNAGRWQAVLAAGDQLARLDPDDPDPGGMVARARRELAEADLAARYGDALRHLDAQRWDAAAALLATIEGQRPGYRDARALLMTAREHLRPAVGPTPPVGPTAPVGQTPHPEPESQPLAILVHNPGLQLTGWALSVDFSPDGACLVTAGGRWVRIWDLRTGQQRWSAKAAGWNATPPRGRKERTWTRAMTGASMAVAGRTPGTVTGTAFSPDGFRLVTASDDATVRMWDLDAGRQLWSVPAVAPIADVTDVAFGPDGSRVVSAGSDNAARVWDAVTGGHLLAVGHEAPVNGVAFAPDGSRIATASMDRTARIWDAVTGRHLLVLNHPAPVNRVDFSPDGSRISTACSDHRARVWDVATARQLVAVGHDGPVNAVAFSPDGLRIATVGDDGTVRIWDAGTGRELLRFRCPGALTDVAYSRDGSRIATAGDDRGARIWRATGP